MSVSKFRSAPEFEERLCPSCAAKGDPDPYWPIDRDSWPVKHGRLCFDICKACKAEYMVELRKRMAA